MHVSCASHASTASAAPRPRILSRVAGTLRRPDGTCVGALRRARLARAVLQADRTTVVIETVAAHGTSVATRITAPLAVLRLYSTMLQDMSADGVFDDSGDSASAPPRLFANPRHTAEAVSTALRWAMGLATLLALNVRALAGVFACAVPACQRCSLSAACATCCRLAP